jgi:hypothetical protein
MLLFLHGEAGGWDELAIAVIALAVLWVAVKLAGRKSADGDEDSELDEEERAQAEAAYNAAHTREVSRIREADAAPPASKPS